MGAEIILRRLLKFHLQGQFEKVSFCTPLLLPPMSTAKPFHMMQLNSQCWLMHKNTSSFQGRSQIYNI